MNINIQTFMSIAEVAAAAAATAIVEVESD